MASVTARINQIKQPRGGFIKPSDMSVELQNDGVTLNFEENVHASIIGMSVDYLTRYMNGSKLEDAFGISLRGARDVTKQPDIFILTRPEHPARGEMSVSASLSEISSAYNLLSGEISDARSASVRPQPVMLSLVNPARDAIVS